MTSAGLNPASGQTHHSTIYVSADGRVLARKLDGTLVELGLMKLDAKGLSYQLHAEGLYGLGLPTAERVLQDVAAKLADVDLDALYDALPSYTGHAAVDLESDPHLEVWTGPLADPD